jgi:hypothetical protein
MTADCEIRRSCVGYEASLIVCDRLRRRFARFKLCADLLDLRGLLFRSCDESFGFPFAAVRQLLLTFPLFRVI